MNPIAVLKRFFASFDQSTHMLGEIRDEIGNLAAVIDRRLKHGSAAEPSSIAAHNADALVRRPIPTEPLGPSSAKSGTPLYQRRKIEEVNDLASYVHAFDGLTPYSGVPKQGFYPDWTGAMTDAMFREWTGMKRDEVGGKHIETRLPTMADGEGWFESIDSVEAAREANGRFVMVTLGACYGAQAVGSYRVLQQLNPMPCKLVAVEPEPDNLKWVRQHFLDNGINPDDHWIVGSAISDTRQPVFFPVGAPGTGAQNSFSTNEPAARENYVKALSSSRQRDEALKNLLLSNSTGLMKNLTGDGKFNAEIKLVSAVTLDDILSPFDLVDYLEVDIQQSEIIVIPPFMNLLKRKVRRIHLGTHGKDVHSKLLNLFRREGWDIIFTYAPNTDFETPYGNFSMNDGVLTVRNPDL
ncbi:FkbM family methyltransferase [Methylocapsa sp. S129]|uniref:FkbM family methyltransferase n=1 Tax=Methylocapsa sp. S129 TaxID=1641869 RepID=UPI00131B7C82|nr:FkbM family methyltransferase [Methylocapsa sp. S129]